MRVGEERIEVCAIVILSTIASSKPGSHAVTNKQTFKVWQPQRAANTLCMFSSQSISQYRSPSQQAISTVDRSYMQENALHAAGSPPSLRNSRIGFVDGSCLSVCDGCGSDPSLITSIALDT